MRNHDSVTSAVVDVAVAALTAPAGDALLMGAVLEATRIALDADTAGFYEHEAGGFSQPLYLAPEDAWGRIPFGRAPTQAVASAHPGIRHLLENRPTGPYALTDVVSALAWWNSEMGTAMRPDWGRNYQFAIPVPRASRSQTRFVWVLGRGLHDFTPADRKVAAALLPILATVANRNAVLAAQLRSVDGDMGGLTQRELVVLDLVARGLTAAAVSHVLGVSPRTAQKHLEHIYRKLSVTNRTEAISAAHAHGML